MPDNANHPQHRRQVIRHRVTGRPAAVRAWLVAVAAWLTTMTTTAENAVATAVDRWIASPVARLGRRAVARYQRLAARFATTRAGRLAGTAGRALRRRVIDPARARLAPVTAYLGGRLARHAAPVAVATLVLVLAGLAALGGTIGGRHAPTGAAVQQGVLAGRDNVRADRSGRATPTPHISATPTSPARTQPPPAWVAPMSNAPVTSCFGMRWGLPHQGIDFALPPGTPVHAIGKGTVVGAGWLYTGYGISVVIDHGNGYFSHYAHLKGVAVRAGQRVSTSQVIGYEGTTGDSTGPHLHFEIHQGMWHQVNPAVMLRRWGVPLTGC